MNAASSLLISATRKSSTQESLYHFELNSGMVKLFNRRSYVI
jgi:hypothetical protein